MLRKRYENLKKKIKKKFVDDKVYASGTGGGPPIIIEIFKDDFGNEMEIQL